MKSSATYPYQVKMPGRFWTSSTEYRYGFQGEYAEIDSETGFNHFTLRDYDARIGRWTKVDPYNQFFSPYIGMGAGPYIAPHHTTVTTPAENDNQTGYHGKVSSGVAGQGGLDASTFFGAVGVGGDAASMSNSTFRLAKSGSFSPGFYSSGWSTGNQYVKNLYSVSKVGTGVSTGANLLTTGLAYNQIYNGSAQSITYVDARVGTAGLIASYASYFHGVEIPVVGEFVAVYGALRLSWDVGWYMGANYGPSKWYGTNDNKWFK